MVRFEQIKNKEAAVAVAGLGYVGLPLAIALAKHFKVIGFDINTRRIDELKNGIDRTREQTSEQLKATTMEFTADAARLKDAQFIIVAVPTPIDEKNNPDLTLVERASVTVGKNLSPGAIVAYESTVYPGVTEEICVPILERESTLTFGKDFSVAYSPERINPGDKEHTIDRVVKVVSAGSAEALEVVAGVYGAVAPIFKAASIKVAEAAKVIENTQRDLNIALMNELTLIFNKMGFSVYDVLEAAGTKWNFLKFTPGLVGGHCIGVDPYYLTHRAVELGYTPEVILAGRRINDSMGEWIAGKVVAELKALGKDPKTATVLVCGITFKENIPDVRNSKVATLVTGLKKHGVTALVIDPEADAEEVKHEYGLELSTFEDIKPVDAIVFAVPHTSYKNKPLTDWKKYLHKDAKLIVDFKKMFNQSDAESLGLRYWTL